MASAAPRRKRRRRRARPPLAALAAAALAIGSGFAYLASQDIEWARRVGRITARAVSAGVPEPAAVKTSEEERAMGFAMAASLRVSRPNGCAALDPRFQAGCRAYVSERSEPKDREALAGY